MSNEYKSNDGGEIKSPWIFKFMAVFFFFSIIGIYFIAFFLHPLSPVKNIADILSLFGIFIVWPLAGLVWISWSFLKVVYNSNGLEVNNIYGNKRFVAWSSISGIRFTNRYGVKKLSISITQQKDLNIDMNLEPFPDFLDYVQEHLPSEIMEESKLSIDNARDSMSFANK